MRLGSSKCGGKQKDTSLDYGKEEPRILTFFDLIATGVGSSLGVGISVLIGELIKNETGPAIVVSVIMAGTTALLGGLCFAECGTRFLKIDSAYAYSYFWCKDRAAFIFGWALILKFVAGTASVVKGIVTFLDALSEEKISEFLKKTAPTNWGNVFPYFDFISFITVISTVIFTVLTNKDSVIVKKLFTLCNLMLIASVITAGLIKADTKNWSLITHTNATSSSFAPFGATGVIKGAAVAFYGFIGFDTICVAGPEIKRRKRNLPVAILATILVILLSFTGIGVMLTFLLPYDKLNLHAAVPLAFEQVGWIEFKWVVVVATFFGFQTSFFGVIYPLPKIINAMANDGLLFHCLGDSGSKFRIPVMSSIFGGLIAALAAGIFPFQILVNITVIASLFVHSVMGIGVIFFRYSQKFDKEKLLESGKMSINDNTGVTIRAMLRNYFSLKNKKNPTALTQKIILANVIVFYISSIGLSVILIIFYDTLFSCSMKAVIPAGVLLCILFFTLISMTRQPKSQDVAPFKVPLLPMLPCLSIFITIFFMVTFGSLTWILFSSWMVIGTLPHFIWCFLKWLKSDVSENSMYEINRINAVKLNESIWKIKSDKKSFYEGTINPSFSDDFGDNFSGLKVDAEFEPRTNLDKTLQLKQTEIVQTSESVAEAKTEPSDLNFIRVNRADIVNTVTDEEEKVQWECVAEIHSEEEFPQESVELEIVDNTYSFLSEVSEKLSEIDNSKETQELTVLEEDKLGVVENIASISGSLKKTEKTYFSNTDSLKLTEKYDKNIKMEDPKKNNQPSLVKNDPKVKNQTNERLETKKRHSEANENTMKVLEENESGNSNLYNLDDLPRKPESANFNNSFDVIDQQEELFVNLIVKTIYETHKSEMILNHNNTETTNDSEAQAVKSNSDEQNKRKEFKEKLNEILKNQINSNANLIKNSSQTKPPLSETKVKDEKSKDELCTTIKTLTKSQIRGKLKILLAKGPPSRHSLESLFNLKIKKNVLDKSDNILLRENKSNILSDIEGEKTFE